MTFNLNTKAFVRAEDIEWEEIGTEDPKHRMLAHIRIGDLDMHLEAVEVTVDENEFQTTFDYPGTIETLSDLADCAFTTTKINGREYFLFALPYGD